MKTRQPEPHLGWGKRYLIADHPRTRLSHSRI